MKLLASAIVCSTALTSSVSALKLKSGATDEKKSVLTRVETSKTPTGTERFPISPIGNRSVPIPDLSIRRNFEARQVSGRKNSLLNPQVQKDAAEAEEFKAEQIKRRFAAVHLHEDIRGSMYEDIRLFNKDYPLPNPKQAPASPTFRNKLGVKGGAKLNSPISVQELEPEDQLTSLYELNGANVAVGGAANKPTLS